MESLNNNHQRLAHRLRSLSRKTIIACILGTGILTMLALIVLKSRPQRAMTTVREIPVTVKNIQRQSRSATSTGFGNVVAARQVVLQPQVQGKVISIHPEFLKGGRIASGEILLKIEDTDYIAARDAAFERLKQAELALELEEGEQVVAQREWKLLSESGIDDSPMRKTLALRRPHLEQRRAALSSATSALKQAELNINRCEIVAPFNTLVLSESVDIGSVVSAQSQIATIVDSDTFLVNVRIPYREAQTLGATEESSVVQGTIPGNGGGRSLRFLHTVSSLDQQDRMVQLLFSLDDPLEPHGSHPRIFLGDFVEVRMQSASRFEVLAIPLPSIHENNTIWTVDSNNTLQAVHVEPVFSDAEHMYVSIPDVTTISLVTSLLANPLSGRRVSTIDTGILHE